MDFVAIDFETANRYRNSACAIGIVVGNEYGVVDEYYSLINPQSPFEMQNMRVHGITEEDVLEAPTFADIWPTVKRYINNQIVVAHNASFDMSVLRASLDQHNCPYPSLQYLCSVMLSRQVWPGLPNYKLNTLADVHGIMLDHHHALADSRAVVDLLVKAIRDSDVVDLNQLLKEQAMVYGQLFERNYRTPKRKKKLV
ncbi:DNA polymerase III PolC-type [Paraliobacillus sp. PM-2]|uniref:3'-5' exonuclease n=1 Tax=Paraliobacillus sp. PM-2 TaxID=1462524 RepID=UPI00061C1FF4|nr:3'-5' exonuclease [Paraliobacillus sp. PM-2]CQR47889.1 DNA polymerase III PolC-type [Paraliobacillus sp. PM-2]